MEWAGNSQWYGFLHSRINLFLWTGFLICSSLTVDHVTAFQTAVALAEYQATEEGSSEVELKCEYLDQVVKMSKRFKEYLSTLPDGNTAKKMWKYGMRNDDFGGEKRVGR
jgi:hypothetical protein